MIGRKVQIIGYTQNIRKNRPEKSIVFSLTWLVNKCPKKKWLFPYKTYKNLENFRGISFKSTGIKQYLEWWGKHLKGSNSNSNN